MSLAPFGIKGQAIGSVTTPASGYGLDVDTGSGLPFIVDSAGVTTMLGGAAASITTPATATVGAAGTVGVSVRYMRADAVIPITALTDATHGTRGGGTSLHPNATGALSGFMSASDFTKLGAITGTNTGDVSLAAVGASPNANAATLTGQVLNLEAATNTLPGVLTAGAQPIGGVKTFSSTIVGSISGNAGTATVLATARAINGTNFDGSAPITVTAAAGTLTGTTLNATVTASSLTSFGSGASISGSAATLSPGRNINGVLFDGSAAITVTAAAGTLTGTTLNATVVTSSLTSVGTLVNLTVTNPIAGSVTGSAATLNPGRTINGTAFDGSTNITVTAAAGTLTGTTLNATVVTSSLTSVGTLANLTVTNPIAGSVTGSAATLNPGRTINGTAFDGSTNITVTAAAGTLTGATLNATVVNSSLTSVGTLASLTVTATITGSISGNAATVTTNANLTGADVTSVGNATTLVNTGTAGTYGDATHVPQFTTDAKGRITAVTSVAITSTGSTTAGTFNVVTSGATGNGSTDDTAAINAAIALAVAYTGVGAFGARGATVQFPPGVYKCNSAWTSPNADGIRFVGAGRGATTILVNFATGDLLSLTAGKSFCEVTSMQFFNNVTRTSGAYINTNGSHEFTIREFSMQGAFEGIAVTGGSIKVIVENGSINGCTSATGTGIRVENGAAGDTYLGPYLVFSNSPASKPLAGIRVRQSGHFEIRGCNVTSCITGLQIDPTASEDVTYGFISDSLFDSCGTNGMLINPANSATARVRSLKFVDAWFAGTTSGGGAGAFLSTVGASAIVDDLEFTSCRFISNQTHGLQYAFGTNVRINGGSIAGNSQATTNTSDGVNIAAGVSNFSIIGARIGPVGTAPAAPNQRWGINVVAGASNNYTITGNDTSGNATGGITDNGTGGSKNVTNNLPYLPIGTSAALTTAFAPGAVGTVQQVVLTTKIPANSLQVGTSFRIRASGGNGPNSTNPSFFIGFGTAGTNADAALATANVITAAASATYATEFYLTVRTLGNPGTWGTFSTGQGTATVTVPTSIAASVGNMTVDNFLALRIAWATSTIAGGTVQTATIECIRP